MAHKDPDKRRACGLKAQKKYEQTEKGKACLKRYRDKRIWLSRNRKIGMAATVDEARAINAFIQRRKRAFITGQSADPRVETDTPDAVSAEAGS